MTVKWWGDEFQVTATIAAVGAERSDTMESLMARGERSAWPDSRPRPALRRFDRRRSEKFLRDGSHAGCSRSSGSSSSSGR